MCSATASIKQKHGWEHVVCSKLFTLVVVFFWSGETNLERCILSTLTPAGDDCKCCTIFSHAVIPSRGRVCDHVFIGRHHAKQLQSLWSLWVIFLTSSWILCCLILEPLCFLRHVGPTMLCNVGSLAWKVSALGPLARFMVGVPSEELGGISSSGWRSRDNIFMRFSNLTVGIFSFRNLPEAKRRSNSCKMYSSDPWVVNTVIPLGAHGPIRDISSELTSFFVHVRSFLGATGSPPPCANLLPIIHVEPSRATDHTNHFLFNTTHCSHVCRGFGHGCRGWEHGVKMTRHSTRHGFVCCKVADHHQRSGFGQTTSCVIVSMGTFNAQKRIADCSQFSRGPRRGQSQRAQHCIKQWISSVSATTQCRNGCKDVT